MGIFHDSPKIVLLRPPSQKILKSGPFDMPMVTAEYPYFSHLLADLVRQIKELPDFSDDKKIAVMSDFGGEHPTAHFYTYSFLFVAYDKVGPFAKQVQELREKHDLLAPYSEFAYKKLKSGPRSRALPEYLRLVDNLIHGAIITVAIEKRIETVFGVKKKQAHPVMVEQLMTEGLGTWHGPAAEKVFRVCHILAAFMSLLTVDRHRLLWYSDKDTINDEGSNRKFSDTQTIFQRVIPMYMQHGFDVIGFGKSFDTKSHLDDLLSIPDLAAGVVQDLLQANRTGEEIQGGDEKIAVMKWMASPSKFLSKITVQIAQTGDGGIGAGVVDITPK
ncbi:hypothetical protein CF70_018070 [Cupriavidus sp. SK-3]|nr:hypothetical protein CF70_018070 [Cupriavidus sp. SK-3]